jgi:histidinol-phosphate aminotransferase
MSSVTFPSVFPAGPQRGCTGAHVTGLAATTPFVAPEAIERARGARFELRLGANESPFGPSPLALRAATRALRRAAWYGDPESHELSERLAELTGRPRSEVLVGSGIDDLLGLAVRCVLEPGDVAVAASGTYPTFGYHVRGYGGELLTAPYGNDFHVDTDALATLATHSGARVVYIANPDNPSGTLHDERVVGELAERLPPGCALFVDEAYHDFVESAEDSPAAASREDRILRFRTFSKGHGLAGLRVGYVLAAEDYVRGFEKVRVQFGVNRIAQAAALASLADREHLRDVVRLVARSRALYERLGRDAGWTPIPSRTNFIAFDVGAAQRAQAWVDALELRRVFVRRGSAPPLDGCVRVTVGTEDECRRLEQIVEEVA